MVAGKKKMVKQESRKHSRRETAEETIAGSPGITPEPGAQAPEELIHELKVPKIGLETQAEELRRAHLELRQAHAKYLDLYEFAPLGYFTLNEKALITNVNLTGAKLLGVERGKLINHSLLQFISLGDRDLWDQYFAGMRGHGENKTCTIMLLRKDGVTFPARLEGVRTTGSDGAITVRVTVSDISDIRDLERTLRESEIRYRNIITNTPAGYFRIDNEGRFQEVNEAWLRMHGFSSQNEVAGRHFSLTQVNGDQERAQDNVDHITRGGRFRAVSSPA